jgi:cytochrome c oxidase cbb3-type subunit 3
MSDPQTAHRPGDPTDTLREHAHDGIQEYDNDLPRWWLWLFYATIAWAVWYGIHYHLSGMGKLGADKLKAQQVEAAEALARSGAVTIDEPTLRGFSKLPSRVDAGRQLFAAVGCAACHGADGTGGTAPNLRDQFWIHGSDAMDLYAVLRKGAAKDYGMPPQDRVSDDELASIIAWIGAVNRDEGAKPGKRLAPAREKEAPIAW